MPKKKSSTAALYSKNRCKKTTRIRTAGGELSVMCERETGHEGRHARTAHEDDRIKEDEFGTGWKITWGDWGSVG